MDGKENKFLKRNLIAILGIFAVFVVIWFVSGKVMGNRFSDYLFAWDSQVSYNELAPEQLRIEFDEDDVLNLESLEKEDGWLRFTLSPVKSGFVFMHVYHVESGEELSSMAFRVLPSGTIRDESTGNFTNYRVYHLLIALFCVVIAVFLWMAFVYAYKKLRYSYQAIFYSGLSIWVTMIAILLTRLWFMEETMLNVYSVLQTAAQTFMLLSSPFVLVFGIALSVSNIQLIRREGFRTSNALGIIISFLMIFGIILDVLISGIYTSGPDFQMRLFSAGTGIYSSFYAFMECFLIGSILCGTLAAKHEPAYDKDYLIILGCQVRKDGGLYPLIQARVDRAIEFYHKQLDKTGKMAYFVPSGGKGADEPISEAAAMERYLLEKGIPKAQILVEDQSKNTAENMRFSKKIIEERTPDAKVAFSTTNYHVFRSGIISRQNHFEPDGMGSKTKWYFWPNAYIREVIGMMSIKWKSMVIVLLPIVVFLIAIQFVG